MKINILAILIALYTCTTTGCVQRDYGVYYEEGEVFNTSCVSVRSFHEYLRSSPKIYGEDSYLGYIDYGGGMPRGHVFIVMPVMNKQYEVVGDLLRSADPREEELWLEARLINGKIANLEEFEAVVPTEQYSPASDVTIVEREGILVRGKLQMACGKQYLVAVQANPLVSASEEWPRLRESYDTFISNITWP